MLAQIDDFTFEVNDTNFEKIKTVENFRFSTHQRLGNYDNWQSSGKSEETTEIEGTLIAKSQGQLNNFDLMARKQLPQTMAFGDGTCKTILILSTEKERTRFLKDGAFLKQKYKLTLARVGGGHRYENY